MSKFEKGTVIISVDDGRKDAYRLYKEILLKYNLPATFNIVTAWIDLSNNPESKSLTLNELKEMSQSDLVEIAAHSHTHKNTDEDILKSRELLCEWLQLEGKIGFASPGSAMTREYIIENEQKFSDMGFLYMRSGRTTVEPSKKHKIAYQNAVENGAVGEVPQNTKQLTFEYDSMFVNTAAVLNYNSVQELKQITEAAIREKACIVLIFHGINKKGEVDPDYLWSFDYDMFEEYAKYLSDLKNQGKVEVITNEQAYRKARI